MWHERASGETHAHMSMREEPSPAQHSTSAVSGKLQGFAARLNTAFAERPPYRPPATRQHEVDGVRGARQ